MKLRLDMLQTDLAYRFDVSQIFTNIHYLDKTTFKTTMCACYLAFKITSKKNTSQYFKKLYPKVRTIIDCTEIYTETPSSLDSHCFL